MSYDPPMEEYNYPLTVEEFFEQHKDLIFLVENLKANMDVYCDTMSEEEKETFMRMNLIMIRQCMESLGNE